MSGNYGLLYEAMTFSVSGLFGEGMYLKLDGFRVVFSLLIIIMWICATIFGKYYFKKYEGKRSFELFGLVVLISSLGLVLSNNLFTTFVFFEIMSLSSYPWVAHFKTKKSMEAGASYLTYAILGGLVTLTGLLFIFNEIGTLNYDKIRMLSQIQTSNSMYELLFVPSILFIFGFAIKAGVFPLHTWLPKSYMAAPAPATALLSTVLSKLGIIGIVIISANVMLGYYKWGMFILIAGLITMLVGGILAVFSIDMKKIISYSSMSQIGYILVGIGTMVILGEGENGIASRGAFLHMINHSVFKMIFFIIIGIISIEVGKNLDLNKIKGWGYNKKFLKVIYFIAMLGISGVPLTSGYISKTLIHEGLVEYLEFVKEGIVFGGTSSASFVKTLEVLFLVGGGLTTAYMLKVFVPVFLSKPLEIIPADSKVSADSKVPVALKVILACLASFVIICGVIPSMTLQKIADKGIEFFAGGKLHGQINYFSLENLLGAVISLLIGALVYWLVAKRIKNESILSWFNIERIIYKTLLFGVLPTIGTFFMRILDWCVEGPVYILRKTVLKNNCLVPKHHIASQRIRVMKRTGDFLAKSVSYALLLFTLGFFATLVYLIIIIFVNK